jgi:deoxyribodipyrimidine photo-lyase
MRTERALVWFRNDLRLHDHEPLQLAGRAAAHHGGEVVPVYCFDPRHFSTLRQTGLRKTGVHRARFLLESVAGLRASLRGIGSDLVILCGQPVEMLPHLFHAEGRTTILAHREAMPEELGVEDGVRGACAALQRGDDVVLDAAYCGDTLCARASLSSRPLSFPALSFSVVDAARHISFAA